MNETEFLSLGLLILDIAIILLIITLNEENKKRIKELKQKLQ